MRNIPLILFGGASEERLVSFASAQNLSTHIPEAVLWFISPTGEIHEVSRPELSRHADPFTKQFVPSSNSFAGKLESAVGLLSGKTVLLALHGTEGEDGTIQELLEKNKIAFTGSGSVASRKAFDKKVTKEMAQKANLPLAEDLLVSEPQSAKGEAALREFNKTNPQMVLKPVANGSSVGLFIIKDATEFETALKQLKSNKAGAYLAERFLVGREITVGVSQQKNGPNRALPCSEVRVIKGRQFDYEGKYLGHGVEELTPAPMTPEETQKCQEVALKTHLLMGCEGYTRTDMILTPQGPILLEINTLPGLSKASFIPQQVVANGENLRDFFLYQADLAEARDSQK